MKVEVQKYTFTYREVSQAWLLLRIFSEERLPIKASLKVRRINQSLKPEVVNREEEQVKIIKFGGAKTQPDGKWIMDEDDENQIKYKNKTVAIEVQKSLNELDKQECEVTFAPLLEVDLEKATGLNITPSLLIALEESKLLYIPA
jgi:hypothetical protein